jgi:hypothetical protein
MMAITRARDHDADDLTYHIIMNAQANSGRTSKAALQTMLYDWEGTSYLVACCVSL